MSTWYLGPAGDLRALTSPDGGVQINEVRYGGMHQTITGARVLDVTGVKSEITLDFLYLDQDEFDWLKALHTRHIPGPHRLISPMRKNRLSVAASKLDARASFTGNVQARNSYWEWVNDFPTAVNGSRAFRWTGRGTLSTLLFDYPRGTAVFPLERITSSVYLKGETAYTATARMSWYDRYGAYVSQSTGTWSVTTAWQRFFISANAPAGAATVVFELADGTTPNVRVAAPQVETGASMTSWELGGAEMVVHIDTMPSSAPRFPLLNTSVTFLEA